MNGSIRAQWNANVEKEIFYIEAYDGEPSWLDRPGGYAYNYIAMHGREKFTKHSYMIMYNYQKDRKFVIEALPRDSPNVNCRDVEPLRHLTVNSCGGPIKARPFTDDDL